MFAATLLLSTALLQDGAETRAPDLPEPRELQAAFDRLSPDEQHEIVEYYRHEMSRRWSLQLSFVRHVLEVQTAEADQGTWPVLEPAPWYDPEVHSPGQVIPRQLVPASDRRHRAVREKLLAPDADRPLWPGWVYDWGSGELRRVDDGKATERAFHNALQGFPPDLDLAEALLERWLDDGSQRERLAAFGHLYTDRSGNAYEGITLYDAWSSGESFETPDTDVLGLVHDIDDEWRKWKAPISPYKHKKLYEHVSEELFLPAWRHRGLRTALARVYLVGDAHLRDGYKDHLERFHALWEYHEASPEALREELPSDRKWEKFLSSWAKKCERDKDLAASGANRRWALERDRRQSYAVLVAVMRAADVL